MAFCIVTKQIVKIKIDGKTLIFPTFSNLEIRRFDQSEWIQRFDQSECGGLIKFQRPYWFKAGIGLCNLYVGKLCVWPGLPISIRFGGYLRVNENPLNNFPGLGNEWNSVLSLIQTYSVIKFSIFLITRQYKRRFQTMILNHFYILISLVYILKILPKCSK